MKYKNGGWKTVVTMTIQIRINEIQNENHINETEKNLLGVGGKRIYWSLFLRKVTELIGKQNTTGKPSGSPKFCHLKAMQRLTS